MGEERAASSSIDVPSEKKKKHTKKKKRQKKEEDETDHDRAERKRARKERKREKKEKLENNATEDRNDRPKAELPVVQTQQKNKSAKTLVRDTEEEDRKEEETHEVFERPDETNGIVEGEEKKTKTKDQDKETRKRKRKERMDERKQLREQVPKRDEDGISYTKQQIRRMMRRVKKGLTPLPTPEEEAEIKREEAKLRKEEENMYADLPDPTGDSNNDEQKQQEDEDEEEESIPEQEKDLLEEERKGRTKEEDTQGVTKEAHKNGNADSSSLSTPGGESCRTITTQNKRPFKVTAKKPVPPDYVCQACQNKLENVPPHWIYDCPNKVTVRKANKKDAPPSAKKVFVSGLFFDTRQTDVREMFGPCGKVVFCKLLKFPDTKRCKGQAYVAFETEEAAQKAMEMTGTPISSEKTGKTLKLNVSRVLNRSITTNNKKGKNQ